MEKELALMGDNSCCQSMTVKEISDVLSVGESTVKRTVEKLRPVLGAVSKNTQGGYLFNPEQVTLIKEEIQKHHNLASRQIDTVSTELEENEMIKKSFEILLRRESELQNRVKVAEGVVNRIADGKGCYTMNQAAKALKLPYGNIKMYEALRTMGILNSDNSPRQDQINADHFKVIVKFISDQVGSKPVTLVTGKGLVYLAKRFNTEIDESVLVNS